MLLETFKTERLVAERVREADFGDLCSMNSSPEVMATLGGLRSDERTREDLQKNLEHWRDHGEKVGGKFERDIVHPHVLYRIRAASQWA